MKRLISALLALTLAIALCVSAAADGGSTYSDYRPRALREGESLRCGIDVSQFQSKIDWAAVAESGVDFAFIRVGLRGWGVNGTLMEDTRFRENLTEAHNNGILVGAYIYSQAITPEEACQEAQYLVSLVQGYQIDLPLVFDQEFAEQNGSYIGRLYNAQLSRQAMTDLCSVFCDEVERLGYQSLVYANPYALNNFLNADQLQRVWLAHFVTETSYRGSYEFWQCSCTGRVPGIQYDVDLDFWFAGAEAPKPMKGFLDVPATHWAFKDLRTAVSNGWIKGCPDGTFLPNNNLTRADFVTMLARLSGVNADDYETTAFPDVPADSYYAAAVAWAASGGIVSGYPDGTFHPTEPITREQMAHIMRQYLTYEKLNTEEYDPAIDERIPDLNDVGEWARDDVRFCYCVGLLSGRTGGFEPQGTATRAEAGTVLTRLYRYTSGMPVQPNLPVVPTPDPDYGVVLSIPELHIAG